MKIRYLGREYPVIREVEGYYVCQLADTELELMVKKSEEVFVTPDGKEERYDELRQQLSP